MRVERLSLAAGATFMKNVCGRARLGDVDPTQEPYRSEFERDRILVFNLTGLASPGDDAHDRAFEDVTSVMGMIKRRLSDGQAMTDRGSNLSDQLEQVTASGK